MDFELNDEQRAILDAVERMLERHAGAERAMALADEGHDPVLEQALHASGFSGMASFDTDKLLEAALVLEAVSHAGGLASYGAQAIVLAGLGREPTGGALALAIRGEAGLVRYAPHAEQLLIMDEAEVRLAPGDPARVQTVESNCGFAMGRFGDSLEAAWSAGEVVGPGARGRALWRVALAAEAAGAMRAALELTIDYLKIRRQFGRTIASFQAVQHRLASCWIRMEGAQWMCREAAARQAPDEESAAAAAYALDAAALVARETHQLSGAIGFAREHTLHVWTMRLWALRSELGGVGAHRRALATTRWNT